MSESMQHEYGVDQVTIEFWKGDPITFRIARDEMFLFQVEISSDGYLYDLVVRHQDMTYFVVDADSLRAVEISYYGRPDALNRRFENPPKD